MSSNSGAEHARVEHLLTRFFHPETSNAEKQALEAEMREIQNTSFTWQFCLANMNQFMNQYLWFFSVLTVENTVTHRWTELTPVERLQLRDALYALYSGYPVDVPALQREKVAQLVAMVGLRQFPDENPQYLDELLQLLQTKFNLGLTLCRATGDVITRNHTDVPSERQKRFSNAINQHIPQLLAKLTEHCAFFAQQLKHNQTIQQSNPTASHLTAGSIELKRTEQYTMELLQTLQQFFTWAPLTAMQDTLLGSIASCAQCVETYPDIAIAALSTLTELLYSHKVFPQRASMVGAIMPLLAQPNVCQVDELYQDKLTDLVRLLVERDWCQRFNDKEFPAAELLQHLHTFTFGAYGALAFADRLSCWRPIVRSGPEEDGLDLTRPRDVWQHGTGRLLVNKELLRTIGNAIQVVGSYTLSRMLFHHDSKQLLESLDNEELDENMETELQHYYNQCLDLVELIAQYHPVYITNIVFEVIGNTALPYQQVFEMCKILNRLRTPSTPPELVDPANFTRIRYQLRDFSSICQMLVRLCAPLRGKYQSIDASIDWVISDQLCLFLAITDEVPADRFFCRAGPSLARDFVQITAQLLMCLQSLLQFGSGAQASPHNAYIVQLFTHVARLLAPLERLEQSQWNLLAMAAANFLCHASSKRHLTHYLLECMEPLYTTKLLHLDIFSAKRLNKAICTCFVSPWIHPVNEDVAVCQKHEQLLTQYVHIRAQDLLRLEPSDPDWCRMLTAGVLEHQSAGVQNTPVGTIESINTEIIYLTDLIENFSDYNGVVKERLVNVYRPIIEKVLGLYQAICAAGQTTGTTAFTRQLLDFSHSVISVLQVQLGESFLRVIVRVFVDRFESATATCHRLQSVTTLLGIFQLIVDHPRSYRDLMPDIIEFSVFTVWPLFRDQSEAILDEKLRDEVCQALFKIFHSLLYERFELFRPLSNVSGGDSAAQRRLEAILNSYGLVIMGSSDAQLVNEVLQSMQAIQERWQLFQLPVFRTQFLASFVPTLLRKLVAADGMLHSGAIMNLLYSMTRAGDDCKQDHLDVAIQSLLLAPDAANELNSVMKATDYPTFAQQLEIFIHDMHIQQKQ
ncbi:exportin-6-like [Anopheles albimanus]|uniref:Exportin-1/Importin-beta-like domain-containing protein n=1 Tax=Anopheles albimanus TaxID=7167 RepID=A0A182FK42_ANOAL|nr:exportin-6-like [Anopheles albimanus]